MPRSFDLLCIYNDREAATSNETNRLELAQRQPGRTNKRWRQILETRRLPAFHKILTHSTLLRLSHIVRITLNDRENDGAEAWVQEEGNDPEGGLQNAFEIILELAF